MRKSSRIVSLVLALVFAVSITAFGLLGLTKKDVNAYTEPTTVVYVDKTTADNFIKQGKTVNTSAYSYNPQTRTVTIKHDVSFVFEDFKFYTNVYFVIESTDEEVTVGFTNLNIDNYHDSYEFDPCIKVGGYNLAKEVNILFTGNNTLKGGHSSCAIQCDDSDCALNIYGTNKNAAATLRVTGGYHSAAIGTTEYQPMNRLTITNLDLIASADTGAAAIGTGYGSTIDYIKVVECDLTSVKGGVYGAGIGSGQNGSVTSGIYVDNCAGTVAGGAMAAGIGGGCVSVVDGKSHDVSTITVIRSHIIATGGDTNGIFEGSCAGSGIGTGGYYYKSKLSNPQVVNYINILDSSVNAYGGTGMATQDSGAGVGGLNFQSIYVSNSTLNAVGGGNALGQYLSGAGIGSSSNGQAGTINLSTSEVNAFAGASYYSTYIGDAIGKGYNGTNNIYSNTNAGNISSGHISVSRSNQSFDNFTITGGTFDIPNLNATCRGVKLSEVYIPDFNGDPSKGHVTRLYSSENKSGIGLGVGYSLEGGRTYDGYTYVFVDVDDSLCKVTYLNDTNTEYGVDYIVRGDKLYRNPVPVGESATPSILMRFANGTSKYATEFYRDNQYKVKFDLKNDIITENTNLYGYVEGVSKPASFHSTHVYKYACTNTCEICGYTRSTGDHHKYSTPQDLTCDWCGYERVISCVHKATFIPAQEPTCTEPGYHGGVVCVLCHEVLTYPIEDAPLGHDMVYSPKVDPTCTTSGRYASEGCLRCGVMRGGFEIPATGHTFIQIPAVDPGCTTPGYTAGAECVYCGYRQTEPTLIYPIGHHGTPLPNLPATCDADGSTGGVKCDRCSTILVDPTVVPALGHNWVYDPMQEPTCVDPGHEGGNICSRCSAMQGHFYIPPKGHDVRSYATVPATCTMDGHTGGTYCANCSNQITPWTVIAKTNHKPVALSTIPATCDDEGSQGGTKCSDCGAILTLPTTIPAKGHQYVEDKAIDPTPTTPGRTQGYHCGNCGLVLIEPTVIPATGELDDQEIRDFVKRLYTCVLERAYDPDGYEMWTGLLKRHEWNGGDVAYGFFFSPELVEKNITDEDFITRLYKTFLDRNPDAEGLATWKQYMADGHTRYETFMGFVNSEEWDKLCASYGILSGNTNALSGDVRGFATRLYATCLGRRPDDSGVQTWISELTSKRMTGSEVARGFFFSDEFMSKNCSDKLYVERLYATLMGRTPDKTGLDTWVGALSSGKMSRQEVFEGFANSAEFATICAAYGINV